MAVSRYTLFTDRLRALVRVIDTFSRIVVGGLGQVNGSTWEILRGSWEVSNDRASSSSTDYPLAVLTFTDSDVSISVDDPTVGAGTAFWVTDSGSWYAAVYEQEQVCGECQNCTAWNSSNCNAFGCIGNINSSSCNAWQCGGGEILCRPFAGFCNAFASNPSTWSCAQNGPCNIWNSANSGRGNPPFGFCWGPSRNFVCNQTGWSNTYCVSSNPGGTSCSFTCTTWICTPAGFVPGNCNQFGCVGNFNASNCAAFEGVPCNCVVNDKIHIFRYVSGTISSISETIFAGTIRSFKAILQGNKVTISAYDATGYNPADKIGTDVEITIDSPVKTTDHGIIIGSSTYGQGSSSSIEKIEIDLA